MKYYHLCCNTLHDRDINASKNILKIALSGQGLPVEPVEVCQEATVEAGSSNLFAIAKS